MVPAGFTRRISFVPFVLDGGTRELRRGADPIHLTPKAFELLCALIEQRPRAIAKAALYERLWPKTFVDEANLPILVSEIRTALGDSARSAGFIRTLRGFGYAFSGQAIDLSESTARAVNQGATCWLMSDTQHVSLRAGENIVGRDPSAEVWLDARGISRRHARIVVSGGEALIEDAGSKNGTWLNGGQIHKLERLTDGDEVRVGPVTMTFRVWSNAGSTETTKSRSG